MGELRRQLTSFAEDVSKEFNDTSRDLVFRGRDVDRIGPGEYAEASRATAQTVLLRAPAPKDTWREAAVRHVVGTGTLTVRAEGCQLNGIRDGAAYLTAVGVLWFRVVYGKSGPEWVTA
jgi:hypothetical protein